MTTIQGKTGLWGIVIGLEVHAQVTAQAKLFSPAATQFGAEPNQQVSLVDAALPGMLPVVNKFCVQQAIKTGLALGAKINTYSAFDRKNYFYPDLPQGYQISQFYHPIVTGGSIKIDLDDNKEKIIRIHQIHLEQDAGKSMHDYAPDKTFIDLNRSGIALMEIVSEADMRSAQEAAQYVKRLRSILRYIGTCDGNMEQGSLRCDANVSVRRQGIEEFGTRCEIKNLNSIRYITQAIEYEAARQVELLEAGQIVEQETRSFNVGSGQTSTMRKKEDAIDYRYFPDPDLLPIKVTAELIEEIKQELPELPDAKLARYVKTLGLSQYDAEILVVDKSVATYFEQVLQDSHDPKSAATWITVELFGYLNKAGLSIDRSPITTQNLSALLDLIADKTISNKIAKQVFGIMFAEGRNARDIVTEMNLVQITNKDEIEKIIIQILAKNQDKVADYKNGKEKLFGFFIGQVMKETGGKANPEIVNNILREKLTV